MYRIPRLLFIALLTVMVTSCALVGFGRTPYQGISGQLPPVKESDLVHVKELSFLLVDGVLGNQVVNDDISVVASGSKGVLRFKDLDLSSVRFHDGKNLLEHYVTSKFPANYPEEFVANGQFVLTGYLDQSDGRHLAMRIIVEGSGVSERFLFEAEIDRFTDTWTAKVDGVEYAM